jgi:hypothetical protein
MAEDIKKHFRETRDKNITLAKTKATDHQWKLCDSIIKSFIAEYPVHWMEFQRQMNMDRVNAGIFNPYMQATKAHKELRAASWRAAVSFPVVEDADGGEIASLLPALRKIIPQLTHKKSVNLRTFLERYPMFVPGEKISL